MADRLDRPFQEWHRLGGAVLLARADENLPVRKPEEIVAESTAHCRESGRLTWVVLDWLMRHIDEIDVGRLLAETRQKGSLPVLGVLADAARARRPHRKFDRIVAGCEPNDTAEPFFYRVASSPLASRLAHENALEVFRRWNFYSNELHYL